MISRNSSNCGCLSGKSNAYKSHDETQPKSEIKSPINLPKNAERLPDHLRQPFEIVDSDKILCTEIRNNGEVIRLRICPKQSPKIVGGGLNHSINIIECIDFRWASAHAISSQRYPLECQILIYCTEYKNFEEAVEHDGAAILSVLYEFSDMSCPGINKILPFVPQISHCVDEPVPYCVVKLCDFLPANLDCFWRYTGSRCFPPYQSLVEWTIFKEFLPITRIDLGFFTNIWDVRNKLIVNNCGELREIPENGLVYLVTGGKNCACPEK